VRYEVRLSDRAAKDLDRLNRKTQLRMLNQRGLRKSRVGAWRIIFGVDPTSNTVNVLTVERRGQVYHRI
jgi:mRNA-degrading endonuclease RelE of RelBE toxin-antitoxin system